MKRSPAKMALHRETLIRLDHGDLDRVVGGLSALTCPPKTVTCLGKFTCSGTRCE
jgi:hypothetical protein